MKCRRDSGCGINTHSGNTRHCSDAVLCTFNRTEGIPQERQFFLLVSVQSSAVLCHRFVAKTYSHIDTPQGMDGTPISYSYGHCLSFPESPQQAPGHHRECCAGVKYCSENLIPNFHEDPENLVLLFRAAPLLLSREFHVNPCSHEGHGHPGQSPLLGVRPLRGGVISLCALRGLTFAGEGDIEGADERIWGFGYPPLPPPLPPPFPLLLPFWGVLEEVWAFWRSTSCRLCLSLSRFFM